MENLKEWILLISSVSVASAVLELTVPKGRMKKAYGFLCAAVFIYCVFMPFSELDMNELDFDSFSDVSAYSKEFEENAQSLTYSAVKSGYETALYEKLCADFDIQSVSVEIEAFEDGFSAVSAAIYGEDLESQNEEIIKAAQKNLTSGCRIEIISQPAA